MRILYVNFTDIFGGGEVFLKHILEAENDEKIEKILITPYCDKLLKGLKDIKIINGYNRCGKFVSIKNFNNIFKEIRLINKMIKQENVDIVFLNGRNSYYLSKFINSKIKKIGVWHGSNIRKSRMRNLLNNLSFSSLDKIIVVSECQAKILAEVFAHRYDEKIEVVHIGIDFEKFNQEIIKYEDRQKDKGNTLLIVARLEKLKGHLDLIDVVKELKNEFQDIKLNIVGEGDEYTTIQQKILELKLEDNIKLLGFQDPMKYYRESSVFVLPSYSEAFPTVNIEAMAAGLPIVTTNVGGIEEAVRHERNGFITTPGNINELTKYISILLRDKEKRHRMGSISIEDVESKFTLNRMKEKVYEIILK